MRVLLINTSERTGGAAIAAGRLREALKKNGIKAKLLVRDKKTDEITVVRVDPSWLNIGKFLWERFVIWVNNRFHRENLFAVDIANTGIDITSLPEFQQADVIHLHWINQGFFSIKDIERILQSGKPVVWTMHDMWAFTGICHYAGECTNYRQECHSCPYLYGGGSRKDLSYKVFHKKEKLYTEAPVTFVACSRWLEGVAEESALLKNQIVTNIPNPINTNLFRPTNKKEVRSKCSLPQDKFLILFGSVKIKEKRKGAKYLAEACKILVDKHPELKDKIGVVVFGQQSEYLTKLIPFEVFALDYISKDADIVNIYNAVDMFVIPSLEDNLPNTVMEAMACGVPCVGFNTGGIPEMIDHLHNGYVAEYKSSEDFANGMFWILSNPEYSLLSQEAVRKVLTNYSERVIAKKYIDIYNKVTHTNA